MISIHDKENRPAVRGLLHLLNEANVYIDKLERKLEEERAAMEETEYQHDCTRRTVGVMRAEYNSLMENYNLVRASYEALKKSVQPKATKKVTK